MRFLDSSVNVDVNKIVDQLNAIASPAVAKVLATYSRQAAIQGQIDMHVGIIWLVAAVVVLALAVACAFGAFKTTDDDLSVVFMVGTIIALVAMVVFLMPGIVNYVNGYQEAANPSYYAIHQLLQDLPVK